jgi:hypothetical protein
VLVEDLEVEGVVELLLEASRARIAEKRQIYSRRLATLNDYDIMKIEQRYLSDVADARDWVARAFGAFLWIL